MLSLLLAFLETTTMIWIIFTCAVLIYLFTNVRQRQQFWKKKGVKYVKPKFLTGNMAIFQSKSLAETTKALYDAFPEERYHGIFQFLQPALLIRDPELIKQITVKQFDNFVDHRTFVSVDADPFWGRGLLASQGQRWRNSRSTLSPSFTSSKMKSMYTLIDECVQQFVEHFQTEGSGVIELEMKNTLNRFSNDVIASTAFGLKCDSLRDKENDFYLMGKKATDLGGLKGLKFFVEAISPTLSKLLKIKLIPSNVANYFYQIIKDTIETREEQGIIRPDIIHLLMEARKGHQHQEEDCKVSEGFSSVSESNLIKCHYEQKITIKDIASHAFSFYFAGFHTISTLLSFAFYELAVNTEVQDRLRNEIDAVSGKITYEALLGMKYLDIVVSEVLRKWPSTIFTDRKVTKAFTIQPERPGEKPLHLEEGLVCWLPIFAIQNDPKFHPDPENFDPERFNVENKHKMNPATYFPFGAGPRNCIASRLALLETKLLIFHVLKNFEVVPVKRTQVPLVLDPGVNLSAKGGIWLGLKKISDNLINTGRFGFSEI